MSSFIGKMIQSDGTLVVVIQNENDIRNFTVSKDNPRYGTLRECYMNNDPDKFLEIMNTPPLDIKEVVQSVKIPENSVNKLEIKNDFVCLNGKKLHNSLCDAILKFWMEVLDYCPLMKFLENLLENPSKRAIDELFNFLEVCHLTITDDGCFLAYKSVRNDYMDKFEGKYDNRPGSVNSMPRREVDDNCNHACSYGFHVGALEYAGPGGFYNSENDKVVICKVNPRDVVSVPLDSSCQKLRCCEYTVVGDFQGELNKTKYSGEVGDDYGSEDEDYEDFDEDELVSEDMLVGHSYSFIDGENNQRFGIVTEIDLNEEFMYMDMVNPDEYESKNRFFHLYDIDTITEL